jgi:dihydrofolate synthase/folylpolyglutamate synthase
VQAVLAACAMAAGSEPVLSVGSSFHVRDVSVHADGTRFTWEADGLPPRPLRTALVGAYQAGNAAVALAMLHAAGAPWAQTVARADTVLPRVQIAGRFQRVDPWIFDVAHNPDGARTIGETLQVAPVARPLWALVTVLQDKDWRGILEALAPHVDGFVVTAAPTAPASRRWDPIEAAAVAVATGRPVVLEPAFEAAIRRALAEGATVLATGSFHTVGDVMLHLGIDPLAPHGAVG